MRRLALALLFAAPAFAETPEPLRQAIEQFQGQHYREAQARFAEAAKAADLSADQKAAWAYCRLRLAAEEWNASKGDAAVAKRVIAEASESLALAPEHAELRKFAATVIVAAGGTPPKPVVSVSTESGWYVLETDNFRVRYPTAAADLATAISKAAEEQRAAIFARWSGPASGSWATKCEIILHASAKDFAHATCQPEAATGHALVHLDAGRTSLRRLDLRADDETAAIDAMPRELTHIILADLFPDKPPPRWAADGMATLAMSPETVDRYLKTAAALAKKGELPAASKLLEATTAPAANEVTGHLVGSAALVDFLVRLKGERSLTVFLRDTQRYGLEKSLDRQFGFANLKTLDAAMPKGFK